MNKKELKKLSRAELLELLLEIDQENETLRSENDRLTEALQQRTIAMAQTGSIAEAALKLNGVFEAAQAAADQYLDSIRSLHEEAVQGEAEHGD